VIRLILLSLLFAGVAEAAENTSTPPRWRGDVYFGYDAEVDVIQLQDRSDRESGALEVASGVRHQHAVDISGRFSPWHGVQLRLDLPIVAWSRTRWVEANRMVWDPDRQRPTMQGGLPVNNNDLDATSSSRAHHGPDDLYFGLRVAPFGDDALYRGNAPASLAIDAGLTFPSGENHDAVRDDGSAGAGEGGMGVHLALNASRRFSQAEPWMSFKYSYQAPYSAPLIDVHGAALPGADAEGNTTLDPADSISLSLGSEVIATENQEADTGVRMGFGASFTYIAPDQVSSGTRIPLPLAATRGHVAITAEHVQIEALLSVRARTQREAEFRLDAGVGWVSDHTLEQVSESAYGVQTAPGTFVVRLGIGALLRIR
jgi:hypothetical protein